MVMKLLKWSHHSYLLSIEQRYTLYDNLVASFLTIDFLVVGEMYDSNAL